jgi:hypothetical protein
MLDLTVVPDRLIETDNQIVTINFNITDVKFHIDPNKKKYFGTYINITIRKVGSNLYFETLYPLRYNGEELTWNYTPSEVGTFIIDAVPQNSQEIVITSTTLVVEPRNIINKINTANNINNYIVNNDIIKAPKYKSPEEERLEYNKSIISINDNVNNNLYNKNILDNKNKKYELYDYNKDKICK